MINFARSSITFQPKLPASLEALKKMYLFYHHFQSANCFVSKVNFDSTQMTNAVSDLPLSVNHTGFQLLLSSGHRWRFADPSMLPNFGCCFD